MLHLEPQLFRQIVRQAQRHVAVNQPLWAKAFDHAATQMLRYRRYIEAVSDSSLYITWSRKGAYTATPDTCTCMASQRFGFCEHRLMAELYERYCETANAQPISGAAD